MENYLYFAEADVETGGDSASEAITVPASSYLFADPVSAGSTAFFFKSILGSDYGMQKVVLAHTNNKNKEVIRGVLACINANPLNGGFIIVANANVAAVTTGVEFNEVFNGDVTGVTITQDTTGSFGSNIAGVSGGTSLYNSYGAGAISTEVAPQYRREVRGDEIITEILVDLTALGQKGDAANDVIGLPAGGAAYIGKYVQASMGTLYKAEVICLEVPGEGTATISTDIDVAFNASAVLAYDGAASAAEINTGGFAALGSTGIIGFTATADDYIYLVEGDSAASTGVFNAGKLVVRLYGTTISF
tara:strand:+ start:160 stop:1074 length:915 start_codon:yes stop_codon:yes gene_type:complete